MNVTVMSRKEAIQYCHKQHDTKTIMISISDPYLTYSSAPFCSYRNNVLTIQRLYFTDADKPGYDVYGRKVDEADLIENRDAQLIRMLLKLYPDTDVIVHCDAGISRSAGVAAAILKAKTGDDTKIFNNNRYRPNMRCHRMVLDELIQEE